MTIEEGEKIGALMLTAVGLGFTAFEMHQSRTQRRGQYLLETFTSYMKDFELRDIFYRLLYGTFTFPENFINADNEPKTRLLDHFARMVTLYDIGAISMRDLEFMVEEFWVVSQNKYLQAYFAYLDDKYKANEISKQATFSRLRKIAKLISMKNPLSGNP